MPLEQQVLDLEESTTEQDVLQDGVQEVPLEQQGLEEVLLDGLLVEDLPHDGVRLDGLLGHLLDLEEGTPRAHLPPW